MIADPILRSISEVRSKGSTFPGPPVSAENDRPFGDGGASTPRHGPRSNGAELVRNPNCVHSSGVSYDGPELWALEGQALHIVGEPRRFGVHCSAPSLNGSELTAALHTRNGLSLIRRQAMCKGACRPRPAAIASAHAAAPASSRKIPPRRPLPVPGCRSKSRASHVVSDFLLGPGPYRRSGVT